MPVALGRRYVAAPPFAPHRFGLFSVVDQPATPDAHWRAGVEFQPNPCDEANTALDGCPIATGAPSTKSATSEGYPTLGAEPFTVYAQIPCSPVGVWPEVQARTVSALRNGEGRAVERVFWAGDVTLGQDVHPHLAANAEVVQGAVTVQIPATIAVTGAPAIVRALGALEGGLGECYGGEGVIHVPAAAVANLAGEGLLIRDGDRLRTWNGHRVAVYSSNNRQGPTGAAPGNPHHYWLYATGAVSMRRTDVEEASSVRESLNRSDNTTIYIAERTYVLNWDCCLIAVQTDLST